MHHCHAYKTPLLPMKKTNKQTLKLSCKSLGINWMKREVEKRFVHNAPMRDLIFLLFGPFSALFTIRINFCPVFLLFALQCIAFSILLFIPMLLLTATISLLCTCTRRSTSQCKLYTSSRVPLGTRFKQCYGLRQVNKLREREKKNLLQCDLFHKPV